MISENTTSGASQGLLRVDAALLCMTYNEAEEKHVTLFHIAGGAPTYWLSHAWGNAHYPVFKANKLRKSFIIVYTSGYDS